MESETDHRSKLEQVAICLRDRINILDARYALLRQFIEKQTDIQTAKATSGTCQDMCPEYERYFREDTKQVSSLEMTNGQPDPHAMVKEYRRAGADQEEPLPHELRCPEALNRTMDYLCCNIMDRVNDPAVCEEWYDFVWSRTRAIRKDITQQHLCDLTSVQLLERCARFHIFCSVALCDMDMTYYDPKINLENLVKCMQSIKDLYADLKRKNILCPNEAEFRCYNLLLNLRNTDLLREIVILRPEILNSQPVQFAIKVFFAFHSNNYIRFFDLVRRAQYLETCLLHRYFDSVRFSAFRVLRTAFTIPNQSEPYPTSELIHQLAFCDEDELSAFCELVGLEMENGNVLLKRGRPPADSIPTEPARAHHLVERKKNGRNVGSIVYGGPLPENPYHRYALHDSFDENGKLKRSEYPDRRNDRNRFDSSRHIAPSSAAARILQQHAVLPPSTSQQPPPTIQRRQADTTSSSVSSSTTSMLSNEARRLIVQLPYKLTDMLLTEVIQEISVGAAKSIWRIREMNILIKTIFLEVMSESVQEIVRDIAISVCRKEVTRKQINAANRARLVVEMTGSLLNSIIMEIVTNAAKQTICEQQKILIDTRARATCSILIEESVQEIVAGMAKRVHLEALRHQNLLIERMRNKRALRLARNCYIHWRQLCRKSRRFQQIKQSFPASLIEFGRCRVQLMHLKRKADDEMNGEKNENVGQLNGSGRDSSKIAKSFEPIEISLEKIDQYTRRLSGRRESGGVSPEFETLRRKIREEKQQARCMAQTLETCKLTLELAAEDAKERNLPFGR